MEKYEKEARKNWDVFYKNNQDKFFKDRHYFQREFPHIFPSDVGGGEDDVDEDASKSPGFPNPVSTSNSSEPATEVTHGNDEESVVHGPASRYTLPTVSDGTEPRPRVFLEVGCGVGNTAFPLLELDKDAKVYCCDFSKRAIELVKERRNTLPEDIKNRIVPFVCDITCEPLVDNVPRGSVDVCTAVFALSAISPEKFEQTLRNISSVMRPSCEGRVLIRDYASGDLAQERFSVKDGQKLGDNFYVRGDGTRAYYFSQPELTELFKKAQMELETSVVHERSITNMAQNVRMDRRWIQSSFASAEVPAEPLPPPPPPPEPEWAVRRREADARRAKEELETRDAEEKRIEEQQQVLAEVEKEIKTCTRDTLEKVLHGIIGEGTVEPGAMLTRLRLK